MKQRLVIFDLDGTTLDSSKEGKRRLRVLCEINGISFNEETQARVYAEWGKPVIPMLIAGLGISRKKAKQINQQWEIWDRIEPVALIRGARGVLASLKQRKFDVALFTSRHTKNAANVIDAHLLGNFFSLIVGIEGDAKGNLPSGIYKKENPESFRAIVSCIARMRGIADEKMKVVYIGDTVIDVAQAMDAGLNVIAVLTGEKKEEDFLRIGVPLENILLSVKEFPEWIKRFWR